MISFESETTSNILLTCQFSWLFHLFNQHLIFYFISTVTSVKTETLTVIPVTNRDNNESLPRKSVWLVLAIFRYFLFLQMKSREWQLIATKFWSSWHFSLKILAYTRFNDYCCKSKRSYRGCIHVPGGSKQIPILCTIKYINKTRSSDKSRFAGEILASLGIVITEKLKIVDPDIPAISSDAKVNFRTCVLRSTKFLK